MDYTKSSQTREVNNDEQLFATGITSGEGTAPENTNPDLEESIYSTDDWKTDRNPDYRHLGSKTNSLENINQPRDNHELAEVVELNMPPQYDQPSPIDDSSESGTNMAQTPNNRKEPSLNSKDFFSGEKITKKGINLIKDAEQELGADGRISDFYEFVAKARVSSELGKETA